MSNHSMILSTACYIILWCYLQLGEPDIYCLLTIIMLLVIIHLFISKTIGFFQSLMAYAERTCLYKGRVVPALLVWGIRSQISWWRLVRCRDRHRWSLTVGHVWLVRDLVVVVYKDWLLRQVSLSWLRFGWHDRYLPTNVIDVLLVLSLLLLTSGFSNKVKSKRVI